ncbi:Histone-lysine N-methyltransferase SUVR5 [Hordeum vulgare]|nr:Histone-lysine N-methyltransferase SUVR5 [Hordeum vulgare]
MQQIFSFELATGKHDMGSGQPLGSPMPKYPHTQESDTINIDAHEKYGEHVHVLGRKRKRASFVDEDVNVFISMTEEVKEVATTIRESKSVDVHPLYDTVMEQICFSPEALMVAFSHLLDNKANVIGFVAMGPAHRVLSLRT